MTDAKKPLVLIIDDSMKNLQVMGTMLRKIDCEIAVANSGEIGLSITGQVTPDLILLDIMMPVMDGFEVCRRLQENETTRHIPVIFITAKTNVQDVVKGFELGAVDYVMKPFHSAELQARVKNHLDLKRSREELRVSYNKLSHAQEEIVNLERKQTALSMAVTANHEINQPLMILQGNLEMLQNSLEREVPIEKRRQYIERMMESVTRIRNILNRFHQVDSLGMDDYSKSSRMLVFTNGEEDD